MKKTGIITVMCLLTVSGSAFGQMREGRQGFERREPGGRQPRKWGGKEQQVMFETILNSPKIAEEIGLTEDQIKILLYERYKLRKLEEKLRSEMKIIEKEQAQLMREDSVDEDVLLAAVEKSGGISTEMKKLEIKKTLLIKRVLTAEQIEKMRDLIQGHVKERKEHMTREREQRKRDGKERKQR